MLGVSVEYTSGNPAAGFYRLWLTACGGCAISVFDGGVEDGLDLSCVGGCLSARKRRDALQLRRIAAGSDAAVKCALSWLFHLMYSRWVASIVESQGTLFL
jgi:hypothetical protein